MEMATGPDVTQRSRRSGVSSEAKPVPAAKIDSAVAVAATMPAMAEETGDSGCFVCGLDNDHPNMLLCEGCNGEFHLYCLSPKLTSVPKGDWFCEKCLSKRVSPQDDGLDQMVGALPPKFTMRFGEICWAQGGVGYGWWPSCIYDPRLTVGGARQQARKNLGKKHLVYFFQCKETPFSVLADNKILLWTEGIGQDLHLGRSARNVGKLRYSQFQQALQIAVIEESKPVARRLDWNHQGGDDFLPSPTKKKGPPLRKRKNRKRRDKKRVRDADASGSESKPVDEPRKRARRNDTAVGDASRAASASASIPSNDHDSLSRGPPQTVVDNTTSQQKPSTTSTVADRRLVCRIIRKGEGSSADLEIGFVIVESRAASTFADVRKEVVNGRLPAGNDWRFYVPNLGPVSEAQEISLGPVFAFLNDFTQGELGDGSHWRPVKLFVVGTPLPVHNSE